ncbi:MAG TPA: MBL fold metallo-hydrolase, partial [Candidatus Aminicenantes bacterium]|nr:MBL fold metallo-hydrolase [Candidatus Aminicenantes bacterium]
MSEQTYKLTTIVNSGLWANSYIVFRGQEALVVDPGRDWEQILRFLKANALSSVTVVATHGHFDHVEGAAPLVKETGASFWLHRADKELYYHGGNTMDFPYERLTRIEWMEGGEEFQVGGIPLQVIWTPGH